jgi:FHA domain
MKVPLTTNKVSKDPSAPSQGTLRARPGPRPLIKQDEIVDMQLSCQDKGPVPPGKLRVECIMGQYQGTEWMVTPMVFKSKAKKDVKIGRSNSKAMKDYGICLSEDTEVSTRHGAIMALGTTFYYHDTESTNGSYLLPDDTVAITPQTKVEITNGLKIRVGQQILLFSF